MHQYPTALIQSDWGAVTHTGNSVARRAGKDKDKITSRGYGSIASAVHVNGLKVTQDECLDCVSFYYLKDSVEEEPLTSWIHAVFLKYYLQQNGSVSPGFSSNAYIYICVCVSVCGS